MSDFPAVTVAILNYNGRHWLERFLPEVLATTYSGAQYLVIDNGSTDDTIPWLSQHYPDVQLLPLHENYGFTGGYNRALPHIDTPYFVLLNSDVSPQPGWLEPLVAAMQAEPRLAAIQPKICWTEQRDQFEYAGAAGGWMDTLGYPFCRGRMFDTLETDTGQYNDFAYIAWASGACSLLRTETVKQHGLFQEGFFAHMEEIECCWRLQNLGYLIGCEPRSVVYHVGGGTLPQGSPRKTFLNVRNSLSVLALHLPDGQRIPRIFFRLLLDGVWSIRSLSQGDFASIGAILKAHRAFYRLWRQLSKQRKSLYPEGISAFPKHGFFHGSIVYRYFLRKKKTFATLIP